MRGKYNIRCVFESCVIRVFSTSLLGSTWCMYMCVLFYMGFAKAHTTYSYLKHWTSNIHIVLYRHTLLSVLNVWITFLCPLSISVSFHLLLLLLFHIHGHSAHTTGLIFSYLINILLLSYLVHLVSHSFIHSYVVYVTLEIVCRCVFHMSLSTIRSFFLFHTFVSRYRLKEITFPLVGLPPPARIKQYRWIAARCLYVFFCLMDTDVQFSKNIQSNKQ